MAKIIMIQGTMSHVGKSILTAGLCRIFHQDGKSCAPFKAQNMALNSFVTKDGLEIGRAQAMQCEAAGIPPCKETNPILLKPMKDQVSQVIQGGKVIGNYSAKLYFEKRKDFLPFVLNSFRHLCQQYDIVVIEGAGSPVELNLKHNDIVNMGFAQTVHAPVILVGDIDRGGIFSQLYGTMALLEANEKALVKGLLVNKFRGDSSLFDPALSTIESLCKKPVLGVVPFIPLAIDEEDSLAPFPSKGTGVLDLCVIRLPHISNFTDFSPFEQTAGVTLRYVSSLDQLGNPDIIFLPGSKNTLEDLSWLKRTGIANAICAQAKYGQTVLGVCGGYQMMGQSLSDPHYVEGGGAQPGLSLLPVHTTFQERKTVTQITGCIHSIGGVLQALSHQAFQGYQIHMGQSQGGTPFSQLQQEGASFFDGAWQGNCYGTYTHGLWDSSSLRQTFLQCLLKKRGLPNHYLAHNTLLDKEAEYNRLADALRKSIDVSQIYSILGEYHEK